MNPTNAVERLIEKGYRQTEIAELVGTSNATITRIKGGDIKVDWNLGDALIRLAKRTKRRNGAGRAKE